MLLDPPIDSLIKKVGNPYKLTVIVSKRAKFLQQSLTKEEKEQQKEVSRAVDEVYNNKITA